MGIKQQYVNGEISAYAVLDALDAANERITQLEQELKDLKQQQEAEAIVHDLNDNAVK